MPSNVAIQAVRARSLIKKVKRIPVLLSSRCTDSWLLKLPWTVELKSNLQTGVSLRHHHFHDTTTIAADNNVVLW